MAHDDRTQNIPNGTESARPAVVVLKEGSLLGDYRLVKFLGQGSFGDVWKAEKGGVAVALKILRESTNSDEVAREIRSLQALKNLDHPYLLQTLNYWEADNRLFIEMELADGGSLKERLIAVKGKGQRGLPEHELLKYFSETAQALDYLHGAHAKPFLHRDLKPANIVLVKDCAKLADFGLLRQVAGEHTATKTQGGTALYMAPESIKGNDFSVYTDLFSFAITYAELRQGKPPFTGKTLYAIGERIVKAAPELIDDIFHPEEKRVVQRALDKDPRRRYPTCGEFVYELKQAIPVEFHAWPSSLEDSRPRKLAAKTQIAIELPPDTGRQPAPEGTAQKTRKTNDRTTDPEIQPLPSTSQSRPALTPDTQSRPTHATVETRAAQATTTVAEDSHRKVPPYAADTQLRRQRRRVVRRVVGVALILLVTVGPWLGLRQYTKYRVRDAARKDDYAGAMQIINESPWLGFLQLSPESLQGLVEQAGLSRIEQDLADAKEKKNLESVAGRLQTFMAEFASNTHASSVRNRVEEKWLTLLKEEKSDLRKRELSEESRKAALLTHKSYLASFRAAFPKNRDVEQMLATVDRELTSATAPALIGFDEYLKQAKQQMKRNPHQSFDNLVKARSVLDKIGNPEPQQGSLKTAFLELKAELTDHLVDIEINSAKDASRVLAEIDNLESRYHGKPLIDLSGKLWTKVEITKVKALVKLTPDSKAFEAYQKLVKEGQASALKQQTLDFLGLQEGLKRIVPANVTASTASSELDLLIGLGAAYRDPANGKAKDLVDLLASQKLDREVRVAAWPALADLQAKTGLLQLSDLDRIESAYGALGNDKTVKEVKKANSDIVKSVLEPLVKTKYWLPPKGDRPKVARWCGQVIDPSGWIRALRAECLEQLDGPPGEFPGTDWYGKYVQAFVLYSSTPRSDQKLADVARLLVEANKKDPTIVVKIDDDRRRRALEMLRAAVKSVRPAKDKDFKFDKDRDAALPWIGLALDLQGPTEVSVDDLVDYAFAMSKKGSDGFADFEKRLERLGNASQVSGYYWVGKVHKVRGDAAEQVFASFRKALLLDAPDQKEWRDAAREGAEYALDLARKTAEKAAKDRKLWPDVIAFSRKGQEFTSRYLKGSDLKTAADWHQQAVELEVKATIARNDDVEAGYPVYARVLSGKLELFQLPVVANKLHRVSRAIYFEENMLVATDLLDSAVVEADTALQLTDKRSQSDAEWWDEWKGRATFKYADVRQEAIGRKYAALFKTNPKNFPYEGFLADLKTNITLYKKSKDSKYAVNPGDYATKMGFVNFYYGTNLGDYYQGDNAKIAESRKIVMQAIEDLRAGENFWKAELNSIQRKRAQGTLDLLTKLLNQ